jgi:hypothetical protein
MSPGIIMMSLSILDATENRERLEQDLEGMGQALQSQVPLFMHL